MRNITIIISLISLLVSLEIKAQEKEIPCEAIQIMCAQEARGNFVITNQVDYQALLNNRSPHSDCVNYQLPNIDFSKYTLIGYIGSTGGCEKPEITHHLINQNNVIKVNISVVQRGLCEKLHHYEVWCLISKISDDNIVKFFKTENVVTLNEREKLILNMNK